MIVDIVSVNQFIAKSFNLHSAVESKHSNTEDSFCSPELEGSLYKKLVDIIDKLINKREKI